MDHDHFELLMLSGIVAASADFHLRNHYFLSKIMPHMDDMTWDILVDCKIEAQQMGVPLELMEPNESELLEIPSLKEANIKLSELIKKRQHQVLY